MASWSNPREARRYLGDDLGIVAEFVKQNGYKAPYVEVLKTA